MRFGRFVRIMAAFMVLGMLCADLVGNRCHLPRAPMSLAVVASQSGDGDEDPCGSVCVPHGLSCSRSEAAVFTLFEIGPSSIVAALDGPEARVADGIRPLPYHPPIFLL